MLFRNVFATIGLSLAALAGTGLVVLVNAQAPLAPGPQQAQQPNANLGLVAYLVVTKRLFGVRGGRPAYERERESMSLLEVAAAAAHG